MLRKMCMNVVFLCLRGGRSFLMPLICLALLLVSVFWGNSGVSAQSGIDSYTKLMLHADGSDQGTSFSDSETTPKIVTNTETYDSYTKLMLHMDGSGNSFVDSAASKSVTANGNVTQTAAQFKFDSRTAVFDGSGDYLSLADSNDWNFGSGDFTIDFWFRRADTNNKEIIGQRDAGFNANASNLLIGIWSSQPYSRLSNGTVFKSIDGTTALSQDTWYHFALVRNGNTLTEYINGVSDGSVDVSGVAGLDVAEVLTVGGSGSSSFNGYIDELRISKGIARWTSNFTPPSSPYGKVATVTSQKKFGTASGEFKGSGEYLSLADSDDWNFGSGDFTIDLWVMLNDAVSRDIIGQSTDTNNGWVFRHENTNGWKLYIFSAGSSVVTLGETASPASVGIWYHLALVRIGNNWSIYENGVSVASVVDSDGFANYTGSLLIGREPNISGYYWNGHLDELRISKDIARWTSNFTPPSAPYETDTTAPTVSSTNPTSSATGVGVSGAISATFSEDMDSSTITISTFTLSSSSGSSVSGTVSYSNKVATFTPSSNLSYSTTYTATITTGVKDLGGNAMSSNYTWSFTTGSAPDTTAPTGSVSGASYTNSSTVTLTLSATDNVGVTGYYLSDSSTIPSTSASGWTSVTSTTSYSGTVSYSLSSGEGSKTIYAWYKDAAGNVSSTASATITYDTTVPTVTISSPTSSSTYTATSSTISLGGSASDSTSGISSVSWSNNKGGNGTATGTASWTVSGISLSSGDNVITVTAKDGANNSGTDTLQVTYGTGTTVSAPTASTGSASSVTTSLATLNGTVNANGASTTAWFNYGTTSGSYGNTSSTQTATGSSNTTVSMGISGLSSSTKYYYRIAASNSGGTSYGSESSFTTSTASATPTPTPTPSTGDTTAPTVTITSPTSSSTYTTTSSTITLSGTASDNSGSVSSVTWSNSKGGGGTASGTTSWTISSISLSSGDNVITVTATDGSGNSGTDTITVTYNVTSTPTPTAAPTATPTPKPIPTAQPTPTLPPLPTPLVSPSPAQEGVVFGFVNDEDEQALEGVTVTIVGANGRSPSQNSTETDENGYYEFRGLDAGEYALTYEKEGYETQTQDISLEEGELKDVETVILEQVEKGKVYGYAVNIKGEPIEFVRLKLKGIKTKVTKSASTDADGFFEFADMEADTYVIIAKKKGYRKNQQKVKLEDGESEEIEIVMKKTSKRIRGLLLEEDIQ